jgi:hypothetical protein
MTDPGRYRVPFTSERLLPAIPGVGFNGCRVASAYMASAIATAGESMTTPQGTLKTPALRAHDLHRMRKATGEPQRDSFNTSHMADFQRALGLPTPERWTGTFEELWDDDAAFTIAGDPSHIAGASTLEALAAERGWTGASHELVLLPGKRSTHGTVMDPMRSQAGTYHGDRIPKAELRQFMQSADLDAGGKPVAERYVPGEWTAEAMTRRRMAARIDSIEDDAARTERRLRERIEQLETGNTDCGNPIAAALERERVTIRDLVDARRSL